ncbi:MAG: ABC transporter permease, partial [Clostridia bacterium]|nr:ABC transporter permease [Clostridia bacterium]
DMELGYDFQISNEDISFENIKEKIDLDEIEEALIIKKENDMINIEYIVDNLLYVEAVPEKLISSLTGLYTNVQISKLNLSAEELQGLTPNFDFKLTQTDEQEVEGNPVVMMVLSIVLFYAIYFCAYQVSSSITTEKTSKIIETLVTSTKPSTIVLRKNTWNRSCRTTSNCKHDSSCFNIK